MKDDIILSELEKKAQILKFKNYIDNHQFGDVINNYYNIQYDSYNGIPFYISFNPVLNVNTGMKSLLNFSLSLYWKSEPSFDIDGNFISLFNSHGLGIDFKELKYTGNPLTSKNLNNDPYMENLMNFLFSIRKDLSYINSMFNKIQRFEIIKNSFSFNEAVKYIAQTKICSDVPTLHSLSPVFLDDNVKKAIPLAKEIMESKLNYESDQGNKQIVPVENDDTRKIKEILKECTEISDDEYCILSTNKKGKYRIMLLPEITKNIPCKYLYSVMITPVHKEVVVSGLMIFNTVYNKTEMSFGLGEECKGYMPLNIYAAYIEDVVNHLKSEYFNSKEFDDISEQLSRYDRFNSEQHYTCLRMGYNFLEDYIDTNYKKFHIIFYLNELKPCNSEVSKTERIQMKQLNKDLFALYQKVH